MKNYDWEPTILTTGNVGYFAHDEYLKNEAENSSLRIIRIGGKEPNAMLSKFGTIKPPRESVRKILSRISQTIFIPDNKNSWSKHAFQKVKELLTNEHFDAVYVTAPPFSSFYHLRKLKKKFDVPIMVDYRDLWYGSYFAFYPTPIHSLLHKRMEYLSLKSADKIIVTNRKIKEKLIKNYKFLTFNDVVIIPHGFDLQDFSGIEPEPKYNDKMIVAYSGILMEYNTPKYFLRAFKKLTIERPDIASKIQLNFIGYLGKENKSLISKLNIEEYISELGYMNHKEAVKKIVSSDVLWLMIGRKRNIDAILPGKLLEYMGSQKPVIGCVPDGIAKIILEEYGASFITDPENVEEIKNVLIKVYELYHKNELPKPDQELLQKYRRDILTEQLTKQLQSIMKKDVL
ncbi:MAG: glycosyltransferase [Ignavibacteriales bacterium]|nr:MAG: glycosyltransferase [Ignavibacteriales bacterium]